MDVAQARDRLDLAEWSLNDRRLDDERLWDYYRGRQDLPYAPLGVDAEYLRLREMAPAPWIGLVVRGGVQRQAVDGFRSNRTTGGQRANIAARRRWQDNKLDARQSMVYTERAVYGCGIASVWPRGGIVGSGSAVIRPESRKRVHLEPDPNDPFESLWAVKRWSTRVPSGNRGTRPTELQHASVFDADNVVVFERVSGGAEWTARAVYGNPLRAQPFIAFPGHQDTDGDVESDVTSLVPMQDAINTTRFNLLLAMQYAAFRQRAVFGWDPVVRDEEGRPVPMLDPETGAILLDEHGAARHRMHTAPRMGVDRLLVFPGEKTTMTEFSESNLDNYVKSGASHVEHMAALSQTPPHYLLGKLANLSAEALTAAESTMTRRVKAACDSDGEAWESVDRLAALAEGDTSADTARSQVLWRNTESVSIAQVADQIVKLVGVKVWTPEDAAEAIPGATDEDRERWTKNRDAAQEALVRMVEASPAGALLNKVA